MKKIFTVFTTVLLTVSVFAQAPQKMSYQAVIRNTTNDLVTSTQIGMQITILQGSPTGTVVYTEIQTPTTNANGLATIEIGGGTGFDTITWVTGPYFIKTETDPTGGSTYTITGTSQLLSVPFALHAKTAESITGGTTETDPVFVASPANGITTPDITNWNTAYGWGNHSIAGYLTSFTETDPLFVASPANGILSSDITNWNTAFGWGNHSTAGYLTSFTEVDPIFVASPANGVLSSDITNWNTAFGWGNHSTAGYLTSFTEVDPLFVASPANGILSSDITNWNTAFGWGNHATMGYLTSFTETDPIFVAWDKSTGISITSSQVSDFQTSVTNNAAVLANTAKNSYPPADATKLAGIEAGAEVNVNADWNATSGDAQILNKPTGTNPGDMLYWNGTAWVKVPVGQKGQYLQLSVSNIPTWSGATYPTLDVTTAVSSVSYTTAESGGNVLTDGGGTVTARGVCWSTSANPTIANSKTTDGSGLGSFTSNITGLTSNTTYYVRAYATNSAGTEYGNEEIFVTQEFLIGDSYQGGIIAYILQPTDPGYVTGEVHGIIAAPGDQSTAAEWGCFFTELSGADGSSLGDGVQNTADIVAGCTTAGIAAELCDNLVIDIYSDWYLPSMTELQNLYSYRSVIGGFGSFSSYWSSTESNASGAWTIYFNNGFQLVEDKNTTLSVRAIRSF